MTQAAEPSLHIYHRDIDAAERSSLAVIARHIPPGARVLDLGCGSGAIGRHLAQHGSGCTIDGLTLSADEAALAAPHYRRVEVANLESCDLLALFGAWGPYDAIVCADVLEHIRQPERVLAACRELLAPGGRALLSIPNASYAGLVAELMGGEFRYRSEGLLDTTHVRFFTRATLLRFLAEQGWGVRELQTIERALPESEFQPALDALPPAVARHLLAQPDALSYQFIVVAQPGAAPAAGVEPAADAPVTPAPAQFVAELYLGYGPGSGFDEADKLRAAGVLGQARQTLVFALPADGRAPQRLRLDPADRAGYLYLHALRLRAADGALLWQWQATQAVPLLTAPHEGLTLSPPGLPGTPLMALLYGDDPWLRLPIEPALAAAAAGGSFEADLGWPMSADYLVAAGQAQVWQQRLDAAQAALEGEARLRGERDTQAAERAQAERRCTELDQKNAQLQAQKQALLNHQYALSRERDEALRLVASIENSTVFRATRPIVHAKMKVDRLLGIGSARPVMTAPMSPSRPLTPAERPVDIIVPVYRGLHDTHLCIESVLAASATRSAWRLIVINDASPEPEVSQWLRDKAASEPRLMLLENEENLGFVGTVNRGMALSAENDVLLLNSDAEVAGDWLDRIRAAAYSDQRVASVTPFSNNATICSYPRFCQDNALPAGWDVARLHALFARVNAGQVVDVPTGVGFCMYIRRAALDAVGLFDVANFGKGYGEENDFCIRAQNAGWRNLHALDCFVHHSGGVSFGAAKSPREKAAMETLRRLHPRYEGEVLRFVRQDPARLARLRADVGRILDGRRVVLAVLHNRQGGTERHVNELARFLADQVVMLTLRPLPGQRVRLGLAGGDEGFELDFALPGQFDALLQTLRGLGVRHVHLHHLLGHDALVLQLAQRLSVGYDVTAHDFYALCPQISLTDARSAYCGETGIAQCTACLRTTPAPGGEDIVSWRARHAGVLSGARYLIAPSRDTLSRLLKLEPGATVRLVPHTDIDPAQPLPEPAPAPFDAPRALKVAVIGAVSVIKGADVLEDVASAAARQQQPIDFHLLGYGYRALRTQPRARLTVHGRYEDEELPALLQWLQPDLVWFPAQWPETYSYTLSACLRGGWPVVVPDLGAFAERLSGRAWTWVRPWHEDAASWLAFFVDIRQRHFLSGQPPARAFAVTQAVAGSPAAGLSAEPPTWYRQAYLDGISAPEGALGLPDTLLQTHVPSADSAQPAAGLVLRGLVALRNAPLLAPLARAIPRHWQARIKSWLMR